MKKHSKKLALIMILIMILDSSLSTYAASTRANQISPTLTFSGTTANCDVVVYCNTNDTISIIVKLWRGATCEYTWTDSGTGYIFFNETYSVTSGKTYRLTVDATINGVHQPRVAVVAECKK